MKTKDLFKLMSESGVWRAIVHDKPFGELLIIVGSASSKASLQKSAYYFIPACICLKVVVDKSIIKGRKKGEYETVLHPADFTRFK